MSVVFPAYNEEVCIGEAVAEFRHTGVIDEIIVINNNSKDSTAERAVRAGARVVHETVQGYGSALQRGLREARADLIVLCEPDRTFEGRDIFKLLAYSDDFDVVLGTRTTRELIWEGANMRWFLRYGNTAVAKLLQLLFNGPSLSDCGCTYRLISRQARDRIVSDLSVRGSHFLPDMTLHALWHGLRVIEVPLNYRSRAGKSKITGTAWGTWKTGLRMIGLILWKRIALWLRRAPAQPIAATLSRRKMGAVPAPHGRAGAFAAPPRHDDR